MDEKKRTFLALMKEVFKNPDQSLQEFADEVRKLTHDDKLWFCDQFEKMGVNVERPVAPTA